MDIKFLHGIYGVDGAAMGQILGIGNHLGGQCADIDTVLGVLGQHAVVPLELHLLLACRLDLLLQEIQWLHVVVTAHVKLIPRLANLEAMHDALDREDGLLGLEFPDGGSVVLVEGAVEGADVDDVLVDGKVGDWQPHEVRVGLLRILLGQREPIVGASDEGKLRRRSVFHFVKAPGFVFVG